MKQLLSLEYMALQTERGRIDYYTLEKTLCQRG